jgi:hypothetical protein
MPVRIEVNQREFERALDSVTAAALAHVAETYADEVRRLMRESPASGRDDRASAPGQPPAVHTGRLVRAIGTVVRREGGQWVAEAGVEASSAPVAEELEYGTARIAPRPAWRPALMTTAHRAARTVRAALRAE